MSADRGPESRQSEDPPEAKFWVWTQHGTSEYMYLAVGSLEDAVERFATNNKVPFGTLIYVTAADNVTAFKVGAVPQ